MQNKNFRVYLRALEPDDHSVTYKWRQEEKIWDLLGGQKRFVARETERKWVLNAIEQHEQGKVLRLAICLKENDSLIGLISFRDIDYINKNCYESRILDNEYRGQGLIGEAMILSYRYAFFELGMEVIYARILEDNLASRKASEKFGQKQDGALRKAVYKNGKFKNLVLYSMLKDEFIKLYGM